MAINPLMLIPQALQLGLGAAQYFGGRKLSKQATPTFDIPQEYQDMLGTQTAYTNSDMPGSTKIRQDIRGNTSDYIDTAARYGIIDPNTAGAAYGSEQDALGNLGIQNAQYRVGEKDKLMNVMDLMGQQKYKKQEWEKLMPFERTMQTASAMMGAGIQNAWGAIGSAGDYLGMNELYGDGNGTSNWKGFERQPRGSYNMMLPKGF